MKNGLWYLSDFNCELFKYSAKDWRWKVSRKSKNMMNTKMALINVYLFDNDNFSKTIVDSSRYSIFLFHARHFSIKKWTFPHELKTFMTLPQKEKHAGEAREVNKSTMYLSTPKTIVNYLRKRISQKNNKFYKHSYNFKCFFFHWSL